MPVVTYEDWLELLGVNEPIALLLGGRLSLPDARQVISDAKTNWPSVSQDFVVVLDGLESFFDDVAEAIVEQTDFVDAFNASVEEFGETFAAPGDRLLNEDDLQAMSDIRRNLLDALDEERSRMEAIVDEIQTLLDELDGLQSGMDEGDPFLAEDIADAMEELDSLQEQLEGEGCLG